MSVSLFVYMSVCVLCSGLNRLFFLDECHYRNRLDLGKGHVPLFVAIINIHAGRAAEKDSYIIYTV